MSAKDNSIQLRKPVEIPHKSKHSFFPKTIIDCDSYINFWASPDVSYKKLVHVDHFFLSHQILCTNNVSNVNQCSPHTTSPRETFSASCQPCPTCLKNGVCWNTFSSVMPWSSWIWSPLIWTTMSCFEVDIVSVEFYHNVKKAKIYTAKSIKQSSRPPSNRINFLTQN